MVLAESNMRRQDDRDAIGVQVFSDNPGCPWPWGKPELEGSDIGVEAKSSQGRPRRLAAAGQRVTRRPGTGH